MSSGKRQKSGLAAAWLSRSKPKDKPCKLSDRDGLYLLVAPSGGRVWRMNYRIHGRQRAITFGRWPELCSERPGSDFERQLAHADGNSIRRAYAGGQYREERVRMMPPWSDHLDQLRDGATILRPKFGHSGS